MAYGSIFYLLVRSIWRIRSIICGSVELIVVGDLCGFLSLEFTMELVVPIVPAIKYVLHQFVNHVLLPCPDCITVCLLPNLFRWVNQSGVHVHVLPLKCSPFRGDESLKNGCPSDFRLVLKQRA